MSSLRTVSGDVELYDPTTGTPYLRTPVDGTDGFTEVLNGKLQVDSLHLHSTSIDSNVEIPSGYGTVVAESLSGTGSISGSGTLSILEDTQTAVRTPMEQPLDLAGYDIEDKNGNVIWDASAHTLQNVGGTTDASSGVIRLANSVNINARNSADSGDITLLSTNTNDDIILGNANATSFSLNDIGTFSVGGGNITDVGGLTTDDSVTVTTGEATNTLHYGSNQDRVNAGDNSVAIGIGARANGTDGAGGEIGGHTVIGRRAAKNNTGYGATAIGYSAGRNNTGNYVTATGFYAAEGNIGDEVTATGYYAALNNEAGGLTATGYWTAQNNTGDNVTATGYQAARENTGDGVTATGYYAAENNTGFGVTASGYRAAQDNTGDNATATGFVAAQYNTGNSVTVTGYSAAENNAGNNVTATGNNAARDNTGDDVTATGYAAAQDNTSNNATASGFEAAQDNTGFGLTATGHSAAQFNEGDNLTVTGYYAARNNTGNNVTATGNYAARGDGLADPTTMGDDNIGIGDSAIRNNQASGLIAIGQDAGINAQTDDQLIITDRNGNRRMTMDLTNSDTFLNGGTLQQVGGTTDANSGEIRLANASSINARNSGNTGNFGISFTSNDTIAMDATLDMNQNEAQNFVIENRTSDPSSPSTGQMWIRTDL